MIEKILCWIFGHKEYNQCRNLGEKNEYFERICYRCGTWYDPRIECEERMN